MSCFNVKDAAEKALKDLLLLFLSTKKYINSIKYSKGEKIHSKKLQISLMEPI